MERGNLTNLAELAERQNQTTKIELQELKINTVEIPIVGVSPLIVHAFSEKARKQIEEKQQGKSKAAKHDIRKPEEDYQAAKHVSAEGWEGFPAAGFKAAIIRGAKMIGMVMKDTQTSIFVEPDCQQTQLVRIYGEPRMRTDMVKIGRDVADVRYRPEYTEWKAVLRITYNLGMVSIDQLFQMVYAGGYGCGVGEMRPERTKHGFGRFAIKDN